MINRIILTGCFDIVHCGHLEMIRKIKNYYRNIDLLIMVDSDERVSKNKGDGRPVNKQQDRIKFLQLLNYQNTFVVAFNTDEELLVELKKYAHIRIVGDEYRNKHIIGGELADMICFVPTKQGYSSTNIIEKIKS